MSIRKFIDKHNPFKKYTALEQIERMPDDVRKAINIDLDRKLKIMGRRAEIVGFEAMEKEFSKCQNNNEEEAMLKRWMLEEKSLKSAKKAE